MILPETIFLSPTLSNYKTHGYFLEILVFDVGIGEMKNLIFNPLVVIHGEVPATGFRQAGLKSSPLIVIIID